MEKKDQEIKEFEEQYSEVNELRVFLEKLKRGETPIEYVPNGLHFEKRDMKVINGMLEEIALNYSDKLGKGHEEYYRKEEYERILCICYAAYKVHHLKKKDFKSTELLGDVRRSDVYAPIFMKYDNIPPINEEEYKKYYDLTWNRHNYPYTTNNQEKLRSSIFECATYEEYMARFGVMKVARDAIDFKERRECLDSFENKCLEDDALNVIRRHPEFAYLYDLSYVKDAYKKLIGQLSESNSELKDYEILNKLSILNRELLKRKNEEVQPKR